MKPRIPTHGYTDPLDVIWLRTAGEIGWRVERADDVYASYDGKGVLTLCNIVDFDPDDCIAQYILHEICHALVAGPEKLTLPNFGLDNTDESHLLLEQATHRLQAELTRRHGLRGMLRPNSEYRPYFDALPELPLVDDGDPSVPIARTAMERAEHGPWAQAISAALSATAAVVEASVAFSAADSVLARNGRPSEQRSLAVSYAELSCEDCGWHTPDQPFHCHQHPQPGGTAEQQRDGDGACATFERALDERECGACGACCRTLLRWDIGARRLPVANGNPQTPCVKLAGGDGKPYRCTEYASRPDACRRFDINGRDCLQARTGAGLSGGAWR